jgi:hypothetical protein
MQRLAQEAVTTELFTNDRFVITSAVSNTLAHDKFLATLLHYCKVNTARLVVVPIRYRNPTRLHEENKDDWFDPRLEPYLYRGRARLADNLTLFADIATQPTAQRPLSGLTTLGGDSGLDSAIFGHPKIAMQSVATRPGKMAKWAMTTGAVTVPDYSDTKAGKKGEFHHVLAALIVERDKDVFHVRHVVSDTNGAFTDIDRKYNGRIVAAAEPVKVLTCGDMHAVRADQSTLETTFFAPDSIVQVTKPPRIVLHDLLDFESASHHNNFFTKFKLYTQGRSSVTGELIATCKLLERLMAAAPWATFYVVDSNHDKHFDTWLNGSAGSVDLENTIVFHETKLAWLKAIQAKEEFSPLKYWVQKLLPGSGKKLAFLTANDSLAIDKIEYSQHGHRGPNGARGSRQAFVGVATKMVIGHSHSPGIDDGVYQVGTSSQMDMDYNQGFGSWLPTHCLSYAGGKRTLVTCLNGSWRKKG